MISGTARDATLALPASPQLPGASRCPVFPRDNPWNLRVDNLPDDHSSSELIGSIGPETRLERGFGAGLSRSHRAPIGIPYLVVPGTQKKVPVRFKYARDSDKGPYPIPPNVPVENGRSSRGDRHAIIVDRDHCILYELFALYATSSGWRAGSGALWDLRSNRLRPDGLSSADAAGLPILPGLVRYDEVARGAINHALRFTVAKTRAAHVYPARHDASPSTDPALPAMGTRLRLRSSFDVSPFPPQARVILVALKRYGMLLADNAPRFAISGVPSKRWNNSDLASLAQVKASDFEVLDTSSLPRPS
jgi:hypothetical protein